MAENGGSFDTVTPTVTTLRVPMSESVVYLKNFMNFDDLRCFRGVIERCRNCGVPWATLDFQTCLAHGFVKKFSEITTF